MIADLPGYALAQREWEAMEPPDGGVRECSDCGGNGTMPAPGDPEGDYVLCGTCKGFGQLTPDGEPFDKKAGT